MAKLQRQNFPFGITRHVRDKQGLREVSLEDLQAILAWIKTDPDVPDGDWFKRFTGTILCGSGPLIKTFLFPQQAATGQQIESQAHQFGASAFER